MRTGASWLRVYGLDAFLRLHHRCACARMRITRVKTHRVYIWLFKRNSKGYVRETQNYVCTWVCACVCVCLWLDIRLYVYTRMYIYMYVIIDKSTRDKIWKTRNERKIIRATTRTTICRYISKRNKWKRDKIKTEEDEDYGVIMKKANEFH